MSIRIHQLAKKIGMENKALLEMLQSRGFAVKSVSSTIDNISAESLVEELKPQEAETEVAEPEGVQTDPEPEKPKGPVLPAGAIIKSVEVLEKEKQAAKEAAKAKNSSSSEPASPSAKMPLPPAPPKPVAPAAAQKAPPVPQTAPPVAAPPRAAPPAAAPPRAVQPPRPPAPPSPVTKVDSESADADGEDSIESTETEASDELRIVHVKPPIIVRDFAVEIGLKPFKLISELMEMGIFASMNQTIEESTAHTLAERHGCRLEIHHRGEDSQSAKKKVEAVDLDDPKYLKPRAPVVCILGHVDHGKTTLLDTIRKSNVTSGEAGGITQHIGAYQIEHSGQKITFIDTPGHAAFSMMRARGANVTDIAVLVIAADDAFKPQTDEALKFAQQANNSIVVAINKMDSKGANIDRVKQQMQEKGIAPEDWGGETVTVAVSALNGTNIDDLLDMILLQAEVLELKANPDCPASGIIVESQIEQGRGPTASVIVDKGTLKKGDAPFAEMYIAG